MDEKRRLYISFLISPGHVKNVTRSRVIGSLGRLAALLSRGVWSVDKDVSGTGSLCFPAGQGILMAVETTILCLVVCSTKVIFFGKEERD